MVICRLHPKTCKRLRKGSEARLLAGTFTRVAVVGICLVAVYACKGEFAGPYACETGFDSCVNPNLNQCETDITADAAHCGACNNTCEVGARCQHSACLAAATELASIQNASAPIIAVNSGGVYWSSSSQSEIMTVGIGGGTPTVAASNVSICSSTGLAFALNDQHLYYWSNSVPCAGGGCTTSGFVDASIPAGSLTLLMPDSTADIGCPLAVGIDSTHLYWLASQSSNTLLMSVPLSGGTASTLSTTPGGGSIGNGLAVAHSEVLFIDSQNGPSELQAVPLSGGTPATISTQLNGQSGGLDMFVANDDFVFVAAGGCSCDGSTGTLPVGSINRFAPDGSGGTSLAQYTGLATSMALDGSYVYWSTDTTVWKVPIMGGAASRVAGNLTNGASPYVCSNNCGDQSSVAVSITVDAKYLYIADGNPSVNTILRVDK